jgi:hypothetical protein
MQRRAVSFPVPRFVGPPSPFEVLARVFHSFVGLFLDPSFGMPSHSRDRLDRTDFTLGSPYRAMNMHLSFTCLKEMPLCGASLMHVSPPDALGLWGQTLKANRNRLPSKTLRLVRSRGTGCWSSTGEGCGCRGRGKGRRARCEEAEEGCPLVNLLWGLSSTVSPIFFD